MAAEVAQPIKIVAPAQSRVRLRDVVTTWPIARMMAARDLTLRHKQSVLGPLWHLIQPLGMLGAFTFIFNGVTTVGTGGVPYALFAVIGVTVYGFVQVTLLFGVRTHLSNYRLIKRVACPRLAIINGSLMASLIQPLMMIVVTFGILFAVGWSLPLQALLFPVCVAWLILLLWALLLLLPTLNVLYRDIGQFMPLAMQGGLFLSPVGFPLSQAPASLEWLLIANPLSGLIEAWRWSLLGAELNETALIVAAGWTVALLIVGWRVFTRWEMRFADVI